MIRITLLGMLLSFLNVVVCAQVDYQTQIQPIFNANCTSCHGGNSGVSLNNYQATMNSVGVQYQRKIVEPGNANASPLVEKIKPNPTIGNRMPTGRALSSEQIALIETWINEGATATPTSTDQFNVQPQTFTLVRVYPNPFNPSTTIQFALGFGGTVLLEVFNVKGELVSSQNKQYSSGYHQISLSLSNQASGIYFYRLTAHAPQVGIKQIAGKMTLIK
jgi:hypothetical protein